MPEQGKEVKIPRWWICYPELGVKEEPGEQGESVNTDKQRADEESKRGVK